MKVSELKPLEKNPFKSVGDEQIKKIAKSIQEFERMMEIRRIVIDEDNNILGGNKRYFALKKLGYKEIPDAWIEKVEGLTEDQKKEFIVKDNAHWGSEWDYELLGEWNVDLDAWGVGDVEFADEKEAKEDDYEIPDEIETDIVLGDLIEIGEHRLLCGDSTDSEQVAKLMNGKKADMVFTDPPYNIGYDYWDYLDNKEAGEYKKWCEQWFRILVKHSPIILITIGQWNMKMWFDIEKPLGIIAWIARNKTSGSKISLFSVWEPILVYAKKIKKLKRNKADVVEGLLVRDEEEFVHDVNKAIEYVKNNCDLVEINNKRQTDVELHKCPKQVSLLKELLLRYSSKNELVLDVFGGSGTTLIACEQLNRTCYMMEIEPKYCQVIIDRMRKLDPDIVIKKNGMKI